MANFGTIAGGMGSPRAAPGEVIVPRGIPGFTLLTKDVGTFNVEDTMGPGFNQNPVLSARLTAEDEASAKGRAIRSVSFQCAVQPQAVSAPGKVTAAEYEQIVIKHGTVIVLVGGPGNQDVVARVPLIIAAESASFPKGGFLQPIVMAEGDWPSVQFQVRFRNLPTAPPGQEFDVFCDVLVWFDRAKGGDAGLIANMKACKAKGYQPHDSVLLSGGELRERVRPSPLRSGRRLLSDVER